ncbi:hypothetical protein B0O80DRAFT_485478 [Mortierella sp. GBAus27b]|nr:hypothetical protein BGX31_007056 [Mortierella sp. GBA43]KAI8357458.1 hypothetical protein B0O80DRAFT_485478 [Mortierella sp. GBAus27b]
MADRDHEELIANFVGIVNSTPEQAKFYLEANGWDLDAATTSFFDDPPETVAGEGTEGGPTTAAQNYDDEEDLDEIIARTTGQTGSSSVSEGKRKAKETATGPRKGGIATLGDLSRQQDDDDDDDDDEDSQNFFAGGEKSGVMVQGPPGTKDPSALIDDILKKAAKGGAKREETPPPPKKSFFTGIGNRLGSEGESSTIMQPEPEPSTSGPQLETVTRTLTFWRNGYSLDDGPLLSYNDPANREFLDAINSGVAPLKYLNVRPGQPVEMKVAKHMDEDYRAPPKAPPKPFEGAGNRLGGVTSSSPSTSTTPGSFPGGTAEAEAPVPRRLEIDETQPVTSIQIRMADGTRMVARFNLTHTVNDIRGFINASRANEAARPYRLQASFPTRELSDVQQTIKDAGLERAMILQVYN